MTGLILSHPTAWCNMRKERPSPFPDRCADLPELALAAEVDGRIRHGLWLCRFPLKRKTLTVVLHQRTGRRRGHLVQAGPGAKRGERRKSMRPRSRFAERPSIEVRDFRNHHKRLFSFPPQEEKRKRGRASAQPSAWLKSAPPARAPLLRRRVRFDRRLQPWYSFSIRILTPDNKGV